MTDNNFIFATVHGSHLYGLAHDGSDKDLFIVTDARNKTRAEHYVKDGVDVCEMSLGVFLDHVYSGSHQAVEAVFSPAKVWGDEQYRPMLDAIKVGGPMVSHKYRRTIHKFCFGDFKRRRHAVRLSQNLQSLEKTGRMCTVMQPADIEVATSLAIQFRGEDLWQALGFAELSAREQHPSYGLV